MELKTQSLDRLLEVLSPALSGELERVVRETRETLEQDFQKRLQTAVREAEEAVKATAATELERAIADATEATRKQVSEELEQQFKLKLAETTTQLNDKAAAERAKLSEEAAAERARLNEEAATERSKLNDASAAERAKLQAQLDQWQAFAETQRQLAEASSQTEILSRFLKLALRFAGGGLAVYVGKPDGLALWKSRGKASFPEIISRETTDPESYFRTTNVRGRTVAAVCAASPFKAEALDFMCASLERAIEVFGLKLRAPIPKPVVSETTVAVSSPPPSSGSGETASDDSKAHSEARRTARLLVSEIKLYHEQELQSGRRNGDIYQRLQKEIDSGRETYTQRVSGAVLASHDYFHEELVRILGENDQSRLGPAYPGPMKS